MNWPDMMTPWAGDTTPDPLRIRILGYLAGYALHALSKGDTTLAAGIEDTYMEVAAGTPAWCDLAVKLISEMN